MQRHIRLQVIDRTLIAQEACPSKSCTNCPQRWYAREALELAPPPSDASPDKQSGFSFFPRTWARKRHVQAWAREAPQFSPGLNTTPVLIVRSKGLRPRIPSGLQSAHVCTEDTAAQGRRVVFNVTARVHKTLRLAEMTLTALGGVGRAKMAVYTRGLPKEPKSILHRCHARLARTTHGCGSQVSKTSRFRRECELRSHCLRPSTEPLYNDVPLLLLLLRHTATWRVGWHVTRCAVAAMLGLARDGAYARRHCS